MTALHPNVRAALEEIKAHPADDTHRLMLADWLEEHGDTTCERDRGTLLRLGCQSAARPRWDPLRIIEERQTEELVRRHADSWFGGLPPEQFTLCRGLFHIKVDQDHPEFLNALAGSPGVVPWIESVDLVISWFRSRAGNPPGPFSVALGRLMASTRQLVVSNGWWHGPWLGLLDEVDTRRLLALRLQGDASSTQFRELLARPLDSLEALDIYEPTGDWFQSWMAPPRLRVLRLHGTPLSRTKWPAEGWQSLEELYLDNDAPSNNPERISWDEECPRLRRLSVQGSRVAGVPGQLAGSSLLAQLETLELGRHPSQRGRPTEIRALSSGLAALAGSGRATSLRRLRLHDLPLQREVMPDLLAAAAFPALRELTLSWNGVDLQRTTTLARSPLLAQLESLDLSGCGLTASGATLLGSVPELRRLRHLALPAYSAWPELVGALGQGEPAQLSQLDLLETGRPQGKFEWSALQELTPDRFPHLIGLSLSGAELSPAEIGQLANWSFLRQIRVLDLTGNELDEASIRALLDSLVLADAVWVGMHYQDIPPDLLAAWRNRFGYQSASQTIPF
jgi:uncharacterized protein (TIGR02996 family)